MTVNNNQRYTLEQRYLAAPESSYVGKVRTTQAAETTSTRGTNFLDGDGRNSWGPGTTPPPDVVQDEFKRNAEGAFRYGGGGLTPAATNNKSYPLSRWLARGVGKGDEYLVNPRFTSLITGDTRNEPNRIIHRFSPLAGKTFYDFIVSAITKTKFVGPASGPPPSGING
jgi:hypothetical protein